MGRGPAEGTDGVASENQSVVAVECRLAAAVAAGQKPSPLHTRELADPSSMFKERARRRVV